MRIIWISSILLFGILIFAISSYYFSSVAQQVEVASPDVELNPFAEEPVDGKSVTLARLPNQTGKNSATDKNPKPNVVAIAGNTVQTKQPTKSVKRSGDVQPVKQAKVSSHTSKKSAPKPLVDVKGKIAIIVHADNKQTMTKSELQNIYLDRVTHWQDGSKIMLYDLPLGDKWREKFSQRVLNMTALEADSAESSRMSGNGTHLPRRVKSKNIVVSYVERDRNAIAYVPLSSIRKNSQVNVLMTLP